MLFNRNPFWPRHSFVFGDGGSSAPAKQIASAPVPTPAPPVTSDAPAVIQAEHDLAAQNLLKKSVKHTILAGDTGGFMAGGNNPANAPGGGGQQGYKTKLG